MPSHHINSLEQERISSYCNEFPHWGTGSQLHAALSTCSGLLPGHPQKLPSRGLRSTSSSIKQTCTTETINRTFSEGLLVRESCQTVKYLRGTGEVTLGVWTSTKLGQMLINLKAQELPFFSFSSEMSMSVTDDVSCAYSLVLHGNNKVFYPKVRPASRENNIITINTILYFPCPSSLSPIDTSHFPLNTQLQTHTHSQHTLVLHASWRASPYLLYVAWIGHIPPYFTGT